MSREEREAIVLDASGDFRKVLTGLFVDENVPWRRHLVGLLSKIGKLVSANSD